MKPRSTVSYFFVGKSSDVFGAWSQYHMADVRPENVNFNIFVANLDMWQVEKLIFSIFPKYVQNIHIKFWWEL